MNKPGDLPLTAQSLARHFIGNEWVRATEGRSIPVIDPATGEIFAGLQGFTTLKTVAIKHNA